MKYLVDVNLPRSFSSIEGISCKFITDIADDMPDNDIWHLAITGEHVILTRDKDFYYRAMQSKIRPKIVLFRLGNVRSKELFHYFNKERSGQSLLKHVAPLEPE